jgi:glycosyltransferase involved in cell wall biosynthesis
LAAKRLSVAHLIWSPEYALGLGGLEQLVVQLSARSQARGIRASILAFGHDGPVRELARQHGLGFELLPDGGMSLPALLGIRRALDQTEARVLHAHDLGPWLNAVAVRVLRPSTRVIATFHEQRRPSGHKLQAASLAALFSVALVACGELVRDEIRSWAPPGVHVPIIPNGVPIAAPRPEAQRSARAEMGVPDGAVAIGYLGGLRQIKGPDRLLQAFLDKFADRADVHLYLVGTGPMEAELRRAAEGHANVHLPGLIMNASRLLPGFDIYAQTSLSEGRSLSMLEAMAAGLPTVAHRLGPVQEIHADGETALLAELGDRAALGAALQRLVNDPALRSRLGKAAQRRAQVHSIERMVDAYEALYYELV